VGIDNSLGEGALDVKGGLQAVHTGGPAWAPLERSAGEVQLGPELSSGVLDALPFGVFVVTPRGRAVYGNRACEALLGRSFKAGVRLESFARRYGLYRAGSEQLYPAEELPFHLAAQGEPCRAADLERRGAQRTRLEMRAQPVRDGAGRVQLVVAIVSELGASGTASPPESALVTCIDAAAEAPRESARAETNLEAIGQLTAGVAHEINTPMQFIGDNTAFLGVTIRRLLDLAGSFERLLATCRNERALDETALSAFERDLERSRLGFLREQAPAAVEQALAGVDQVRNIVQALKEFSHPGDEQTVLVDIHHLLRMASTVTRNAWRYAAVLTLDLCDHPPPVRGYPQELGQVLINLIVNAAHAVEERLGGSDRGLGKIVLRTRALPDGLEISIEDDGAGIPEAIRGRIMNPFFTTKPVGKGTGQGLAMARLCVVERHQGRISFESQVGVGTTFRVFLPSASDD
jgi:signal transduction histidine kinase